MDRQQEQCRARELLGKLGGGRSKRKRAATSSQSTPNEGTGGCCFTDATRLLRACAVLHGGAAAARQRGQLMHLLLSEALSLAVPLEHISALPPEHWDPTWFDAANPRAFLPLDRAISLLQSQGRTAPARALGDLLSALRPSPDLAPAALTACFLRTLGSDYVWLPALAWALERLPSPVLAALCGRVFGEDPRPEAERAREAAADHYRAAEDAIMRENLARALSRLEPLLVEAFTPAATPPDHLPLPVLVLRLARLVLKVRYAAEGEAQAREEAARGDLLRAAPTEAELKVLRQGLLGYVIRLAPAPERMRPGMQEALREAQVPFPWALCYAKM